VIGIIHIRVGNSVVDIEHRYWQFTPLGRALIISVSTYKYPIYYSINTCLAFTYKSFKI